MAEDWLPKASSAETLLAGWAEAGRELSDVMREIGELPSCDGADEAIEKASQAIGRAEEAERTLDEIRRLRLDADGVAKLLKAEEADARKADAELLAALEGVTVCPLTLEPLSAECLSRARVPATDPEPGTTSDGKGVV
jgi:hypothetical protein